MGFGVRPVYRASALELCSLGDTKCQLDFSWLMTRDAVAPCLCPGRNEAGVPGVSLPVAVGGKSCPSPRSSSVQALSASSHCCKSFVR